MIKLHLRSTVALRISAVLTLVGLAMMAWSILQPTPLPVMLAMSLGQGIGSLAFGLYLYVVIRDLREFRRDRRRRSSLSPESRDAP
jgi:hypothetical protein